MSLETDGVGEQVDLAGIARGRKEDEFVAAPSEKYASAIVRGSPGQPGSDQAALALAGMATDDQARSARDRRPDLLPFPHFHDAFEHLVEATATAVQVHPARS